MRSRRRAAGTAVRLPGAARVAAVALALAASCDDHTALDVEACGRNCEVLESACAGFDGAACRAACDAGDRGRLDCIERLVQDQRGDCIDFVACFPGGTGLPGDAGDRGDGAAGD